MNKNEVPELTKYSMFYTLHLPGHREFTMKFNEVSAPADMADEKILTLLAPFTKRINCVPFVSFAHIETKEGRILQPS